MGYIVGDSITKIVAEHGPLPQKLTVSTNIKITNIELKAVNIGTEKKSGATFEFMFTASYGETSSKIEISGSVIYVGDKKELDEIEKVWKEKKIIKDEELALIINNRALELGLLQAISLASQLRLPTPIMLPRFVAAQPETKPEVKEKKA